MSVFGPALILGTLALVLWWKATDAGGRYREWLRRKDLEARGLCPDCEMAWSHCTCVVVSFEPWDDE